MRTDCPSHARQFGIRDPLKQFTCFCIRHSAGLGLIRVARALFALFLRSVSASFRPFGCFVLVLLLLRRTALLPSTLLPIYLPPSLCLLVLLLYAVQLPHDLLVQVDVAVHHTQPDLTASDRAANRPPGISHSHERQMTLTVVVWHCVVCGDLLQMVQRYRPHVLAPLGRLD